MTGDLNFSSSFFTVKLKPEVLSLSPKQNPTDDKTVTLDLTGVERGAGLGADSGWLDVTAESDSAREDSEFVLPIEKSGLLIVNENEAGGVHAEVAAGSVASASDSSTFVEVNMDEKLAGEEAEFPNPLKLAKSPAAGLGVSSFSGSGSSFSSGLVKTGVDPKVNPPTLNAGVGELPSLSFD